jgi:hypothetical protein
MGPLSVSQIYRNYETPPIAHRVTCHQVIQFYTHKKPKCIIHGHFKDSFMSSTNIPGAATKQRDFARSSCTVTADYRSKYLYTLLATAKPSPVAYSTTLRYVGVMSSNIILFINGIFRLAAILREEKSEKTVMTNTDMKLNTSATEYFHLLREV